MTGYSSTSSNPAAHGAKQLFSLSQKNEIIRPTNEYFPEVATRLHSPTNIKYISSKIVGPFATRHRLQMHEEEKCNKRFRQKTKIQ